MTTFFSCFRALISAACSAFSLSSKSGTTSASVSLSLWYKESAEVSVPKVVIIKSLPCSSIYKPHANQYSDASSSDAEHSTGARQNQNWQRERPPERST